MSETPNYETFVANVDLSGPKYRFVVNSSNQLIGLATTAGGPVTGVLQTKPNSGQVGTVKMAGKTKMFAGGAITGGGQVTGTASGTATAVASGDYAVGIALESVSSGSQFDMFITHAGYTNA